MSYNLFNYVQCEGVHQAAEVASSGSDWLPFGTALIALTGALWVNYRTIHHTKRSELEREERALLLRTSEEIQECHAKINWFYGCVTGIIEETTGKSVTSDDIDDSARSTLKENPITYLHSTFSTLHHIQGRLHHISANKALTAITEYIISTADMQSEVFEFLTKTSNLTKEKLDADYDNVNQLRLKVLEEVRALRK
jgi:hypothetical protein